MGLGRADIAREAVIAARDITSQRTPYFSTGRSDLKKALLRAATTPSKLLGVGRLKRTA